MPGELRMEHRYFRLVRSIIRYFPLRFPPIGYRIDGHGGARGLLLNDRTFRDAPYDEKRDDLPLSLMRAQRSVRCEHEIITRSSSRADQAERVLEARRKKGDTSRA